MEYTGKVVTTFDYMEPGDYTFIIADIMSEGIGPDGKISAFVGDTLLWEVDGDFGFLVEKPFLIQ